jgi:hypothetical protein
MAKTCCKCKIKWKGWKRPGYADVMNSPGVQSLLDKRANAVVSQANASFTPHGGEGKGYGMKEFNGKLVKGRSVATLTLHAHSSERIHNRLQAVFGGE